ncbi:hypothetical protein T440DRAFT_444172 [Plenodomus tracheiphilus IPT5]|uniref:RRM domain-containing protein n=1 Tax=Plenodomus tracheiphilus IPT5 TaxID=1408161 RepID=A0A6A7BD00_9PLEO|nr:hypothetical protein T440DRAFT_444172 [Plenodomus tracheiphilus IPT5]
MAPTKRVPKTVSDFLVLPLSLPSLPGLPASAQTAKHYLYIKPHTPSIPTADASRSLFIANIPIDADESSLRALFAGLGGGAMVERVEFDAPIPAPALHKRWKGEGGGGRKSSSGVVGGKDKEIAKKRKREIDEETLAEGVIEDAESALPRVWASEVKKSGSGAVVVFVDGKSCRGAFRGVKGVVKTGGEVAWRGGEGVGVARYKAHLTLTYPPPAPLLSSISAYTSQFSALETLRTRLRKRARSAPDEEGFVTVTRGGRAGPARIGEAEKKKRELDERRKGIAKDDFYRFQNRERRKEKEGELRRRFEEDRRRVGEGRARGGGVPEV